MQNKLVLVLLMTALVTSSAFTLEIKGTAPSFQGDGPDIVKINDLLKETFEKAKDELNKEIKDINPKPEDFIKSWGDAGVFASHGATQRAYGGYKHFAVTVGPMVGLRLPGSPFTIMDEMDGMLDKLSDKQDMSLGFNPQIFNINVGVNASKFLLKDLYLGLHFGVMKLDNLIDGFSFSTFSIGATANYQLVPPISLAKVVLWRGVNVGSGLIYQGTKINYNLSLDSIVEDIGTVGKLTIDPALTLGFNIKTVVIPIEATTAVRLLWFLNIPLGVGLDLGFGKSDLQIGMDAKITPKYGDYEEKKDSGSLSVDAGGNMSPTAFNIKLMTGVGFNFGPVVLDIPVTFYLNNGYSIGVSLGFVW